ncbi:MAG: hypothetical protein EAS48_06630 [Chryseobacterium sp.]|nr:MAG: hypothetical protein EAS48_06630 [Chryseobacterium sp.]
MTGRGINKIVWATGVISMFYLSSCSPSQYLKEGEVLYTGAKVDIVNDTMTKRQKNNLRDGIKDNLRPKPNSSFLGLRPRLWIYGAVKEPKKQKGLAYWLKYRVGEKPIVLGDVDPDFNRRIAVNYSENKGFFNARASYETEVKNRKAEVDYTVTPGARYLNNLITYEDQNSLISTEIQKTADGSLLKKGKPFDLNVIKAERERIDNNLKERGFYYFHPDNIIVQADSTVTNEAKVDLNVRLKDDTPELSKQQFTIDKVIVFPDYSLRTGRNAYQIPTNVDSVVAYKDMYIIDPEKKFKPQIFDRALYFHSGDVYNRSDHNLSLNRLIGLGTFKFVKNQFVISDSLNNKFDAYYLLTPRDFQSLQVEATGKTNSADFVGSSVNLHYLHRNFFRGAEQFKATLYGGFDVQMGGKRDKEANNIYRIGGDVTLSIPRIVAPFKFQSSSAFVPRTQFHLGYEYQSRTQLYTLHNFSGSFGYLWKENAQKEHELKVLDVSVVNPQKVTAKYDSIAKKYPNLQRVVDRQFIFGPTYSFTYTTTMLPKKNTFYYKGTADLSGTLAGLFSGANAKKDDQKRIFGTPFSQYAKIENDFRYFRRVGNKDMIAARLIAGLAYPYGNSLHVPFSKQFFIGGSNSIRAFRARTLGPGSYNPYSQPSTFFFDQAGDIKLELNAEYRANLYKFLNAAVFVDAGNIWLVNDEQSLPGGKFSKDWLSEIAVGAGVGLRLDFNILVLRLDLATPLRIPYDPKGDRWAFNKIDFGSKEWRRDNLILNIAIGYPF